ncbi:branched-chain amino acid ABC transporter permease [Halorussus sp. MSC15.2]|uniref:branched-chain amino acid ABC transporter permease n=1 Tax=Halorussus sp. MSC15.2 TaxID=2283638 RepID=UPI0013D7D10C|nr:branched-chain amino acid ABC transporter permease [Halorussus sp. MSC15.2]NEU58032.1 branched-chain amino acid ABC transporter permease [Halorussus sp. MSC15.2]
MASLLQLFANGVIFGSIVLLASVGLSLLYGIGNFANFAHGELLTIGAYVAFVVKVTLGLPFVAALGVSVVATAVVGVALDRVLFVRHRDSSPIVLLIVTIGVALVLRSLIRIVWTNQLRSYRLPLRRGIQFVDTTLHVGSYDVLLRLRVTRDGLTIVAVAALFALVTHLFLTRTKMGVAMRATADNRSLAKITGVDTDRVLRATWGLSGALAAVGGAFLGVQTGVIQPRMGFNILLVAFAAVILGGIGSPYGAMVGAYVIGIAQEMSIAVPGVSASYRAAVSFLVLVVVLLVRPEGIAGGRWG